MARRGAAPQPACIARVINPLIEVSWFKHIHTHMKVCILSTRTTQRALTLAVHICASLACVHSHVVFVFLENESVHYTQRTNAWKMRPSPSVGIGLWVEFWGQRRERAAHPTQAPIHMTRMSPGNSCVYIKFISVVYVPLIGFLMCVCVCTATFERLKVPHPHPPYQSHCKYFTCRPLHICMHMNSPMLRSSSLIPRWTWTT